MRLAAEPAQCADQQRQTHWRRRGGGPSASGEIDVFNPAIEPKPNAASQTATGTTTVGAWDC
jgi:hypothetical protein